ncbi:MAG: hypothetical protein JWO02_1331 [Solirubrobacterales bacterium]|nr:hypothetical protein [Solirubrobacterales bacterium]
MNPAPKRPAVRVKGASQPQAPKRPQPRGVRR